MAGHSKWANIKHRKAAQDARKGKVFTKLIRELTIAARNGGDPRDNPRLRAVMDKALTVNMTRDTIDRAIARGVGGGDNENVEELTYEGYGPSGVAVYIEAMTDNRNRTAADVRHAFTKCAGNLGTDGSVAYLFRKVGQITYGPGLAEEAVMEAALEAGADDVVSHDDGSIEVLTTPELFGAVKDALDAAGLVAESAEVTFLASTKADITDRDIAEKVMKLVDMLEDLDDVQNVYTNADISADVLEQMS